MRKLDLINTLEFSPEAQKFKKYKRYTSAYQGTKQYYDYWDRQIEFIKNGFEVGGVRITGAHYFYLNFNQILLVPKDSFDATKSTRRVQKVTTFPHFWDGDYDFFHAVEIAENGISEEDYKKLQLHVEIEDLSGGFHMAVLKARGKGFSYKTGSILVRNWAIGRNSKNYAVADDMKYLVGDGLLNKCWDPIAFLEEHTCFKYGRLIDKDTHKMCGYKEKEATGFVEKGRKNQIMGISIKDNPDKIRGIRGDKMFFEEAGKSPGLLKAWEVARPAFEQGAITTGMLMAYGTGGSNEEGQEGIRALFENPKGHNCLPFNNIWDDGANGTTCSFFFPAYLNYEGYINEHGISDSQGAKQYLIDEREERKNSPNPKVLAQFVAEQPFTPQEALLQANINMFPVRAIQERIHKVNREKLWNSLTDCVLFESGGKIRFTIDPDLVPPPIVEFPLKPDTDSTGCVQILEPPIRINGEVPDGLYVIVHDPYAKDKTKEVGSLGSAYVIKLWNNFSQQLSGCIVASYVGRPNTMNDYNEQLYLLSKFYNAKIGFENNRGTVKQYGEKHKLLHRLIPTPAMTSKGVGKQVATYGITMTEPLKDTAEIYLRDWLSLQVGGDAENPILMLDTIVDLALLEELLRFNRKKGNFDRVMSLMIGTFFVEQERKEEVNPTKRDDVDSFFKKRLFA